MTTDGIDGPHALLVIQGHDTELDQLTYRRMHLSEQAELDRVIAQQQSIEAEGANVSAERDELERRRVQLEADLGDTEKRLADLDRQMRSGAITASRDLLAMTEQVASMKRRQSDIEDTELAIMEAIDPLDARRVELQEAWAVLEADALRLTAEVAEAQAALDADIARVKGARSDAAAVVPPQLLATYERLRSRLGGVGAAPLVGSSCGGCHLTLSASELDQIRRAPLDALVACEQCGRILVP
ncbi:MAG: phospholipase [Acidimicrobiales bacterium]